MWVPELQQGVTFLVVVVGLFALAEVGRMVEDTLRGTMQIVRVQGRIWFSREEWRRAFPAMLRGAGVGFFCGAAPGLGGTISAMLAYVAEKRLSRHPEEFGTGAIEGVAAPEAAVNADTCGAFVHLLALGIPASGSTAVIMGAFVMYGIQPGPMLFQTHPDLVWGLIASMYVGNLMLLVLNLPLVGLFARVLYVPPGILLVIILGISSVGVYSFDASAFNLYMALLFGVVGHVFRKLDIPKAPLIFGVILGGRVEQSFRQALTISGGDPVILVGSPIAAGLLALAALTVAFSFWAKRKTAATLGPAKPPGSRPT
jgi:putative tricarboxylic transport membrane protein